MVDGRQTRLQLWAWAADVGPPPIFYRGAHGAAVVYVPNRQSFDGVGAWLRAIDQRGPEHVAKLLVGVSDGFREVSEGEVERYAEGVGVPRVEVREDGQSIDRAFDTLAALSASLASRQEPYAPLSKPGGHKTHDYWGLESQCPCCELTCYYCVGIASCGGCCGCGGKWTVAALSWFFTLPCWRKRRPSESPSADPSAAPAAIKRMV